MNSNIQFDQIAQLDLDPIKVKLMHKESGEGWSLAYATMVEGEYRRFLCLMKLYPNEPMAPLFDVDIFWHYHILDTVKYAADCEAVFGYFLHHFPYLGLRGEDDEAAHHQVGARMKELYETTFGAGLPSEALAAAAGQTAWSMSGVGIDGAYAVRPSTSTMVTAWSMAHNESGISARPSLPAGATAWSMSQGDSRSSARPSLAAGATAWSMAQSDSRTSARPSLAAGATAWSMAQSDSRTSARPSLSAGATAWSMSHSDSGTSARPSLAAGATAWSMNPAHAQEARLERPALAIAA